MTFDELAPALNTGDIFLFHGTEWTSRLIEEVTHSSFSHVAMVVRQPGSSGLGGLSLWQSYEPTGGVGSSPAKDFLEKYDVAPGESLYARQLQAQRTPAMQQALQAFMAEVDGRHFPSIVGLVLHWLEGEQGINSGTADYFCSQLLAATYMQIGWLQGSPPPNAYSPEAFSTQNPGLPLQLGASFGPQIVVNL